MNFLKIYDILSNPQLFVWSRLREVEWFANGFRTSKWQRSGRIYVFWCQIHFALDIILTNLQFNEFFILDKYNCNSHSFSTFNFSAHVLVLILSTHIFPLLYPYCFLYCSIVASKLGLLDSWTKIRPFK